MKGSMSRQEVKALMKEQREASDPQPSAAKRVVAWVLLILLAAGGFFWYWSASRKPESRLIVRDATPSPSPSAPKSSQAPSKVASFFSSAAKAPAPQPGQQTFKLKDGRAVTGKVVKEDPDYYTVEVSGGRQEIVFKTDLKNPGN